jgi:hypothetical protein
MHELKRRHEKSHTALAGGVALREAQIDYSTFISLSKLSAWSTCFMFHRT